MPGHDPPGQVAGVAEPALLLRVSMAAVLAGEEATVQALPSGGRKEPVGLQAAGTVGLIQVRCVSKQLSLGALLLNPALQPPWENTRNKKSLRHLTCFCNRF